MTMGGSLHIFTDPRFQQMVLKARALINTWAGPARRDVDILKSWMHRMELEAIFR